MYPSSVPYFEYAEKHKSVKDTYKKNDYNYYLRISPDATPEEIIDFINRYWKKDRPKFNLVEKVKPNISKEKDLIIYWEYFQSNRKPKEISEVLNQKGFNTEPSNISKRVSQIKKLIDSSISFQYLRDLNTIN